MKRFLACFIDIIITQIIFMSFINIFSFENGNMKNVLIKVSYFVFFIAYNFVCDSILNRNTIGKKLLGLKPFIPLANGKIYNIVHGLLRYICFIFLPFTVVYYVFVGKGKMPYDDWFE